MRDDELKDSIKQLLKALGYDDTKQNDYDTPRYIIVAQEYVGASQ